MRHRNSFLLPLVLSILLHFLLIFTWPARYPTVASSVKIVPVSYINSSKRNEILRPVGPQDDKTPQPQDGIRKAQDDVSFRARRARNLSAQGNTKEQKTARPFPSEMDALLQNDNRLPDYPYAALQMQLEGIVVVQLDLATDGEVLQATVAQSSGHEILDQAACEALQMWKFQPQTKTPLLQRVVFNLDQNNTLKEAE